jgi:transposase
VALAHRGLAEGRPTLERVGLEARSLTAWLHEGRRGAGLSAIRIGTRQANAAMKTMPNKTDRNDARAQIMRTEAGIKPGTPWRTAFADRVRERAGGDILVMPLVEPLLAILATMLRKFARLTK